MIGRLNHIAIAVPDLARAAELYRTVMGAKVSAPKAQPAHGVTVVFVELPNTKIELLHPLGEKSPIANFLARNADGGILVPSFQGNWASAAIDVADLAVTPKGATGHGHLKFAKLEDLAPLLGTPLAGAIEADVATEPNDAGKVTVTLRGDRLASGATGVRTLQLDATVADPMGLAVADATLKADGLSGVADISNRCRQI